MLKPLLNESELQESLEQLLVSKLLPDKAQEQFKQGNIGREFLAGPAEILKALSTDYVNLNSPNQFQSAQALAYALYFTPINFVKVLRALQQANLNSDKIAKVLDFGSGPGTASLAALSSYSNIKELVAVEQASAMRDIAVRLLPDFCSVCSDIKDVKTGAYDLIICANSLNELDSKHTPALLHSLCALLSPSGYLVIVEPAIKSVSHKIMAMRDWLVANTDLHVTFPCTHSAACPMLTTSPNDWCHTELNWQTPKLVRQLDALTGFNKHRLKTSLFIFSKTFQRPDGYRVVNFPRKLKQGIELTLCGNQRYQTVIAPKKALKKVQNYDWISEIIF